jgi:hypothetical protein
MLNHRVSVKNLREENTVSCKRANLLLKSFLITRQRSLENNTNTFALQISLRQEEIMPNIDIGSCSFKKLLVFVTPENRGDCQLQLSFCKTS